MLDFRWEASIFDFTLSSFGIVFSSAILFSVWQSVQQESGSDLN